MKIIKNRFFLAAVCLLVSIFLLWVYAAAFNSSSAVITVYQTTTPIVKGAQITEEMLTPVSIVRGGLSSAMTDKEKIIGSYAVCDIVKGQLIFDGSLQADMGASALAQRIDGTKIAYSITVNSTAAGVSGKLLANDIISIYVTSGDQSTLPPELTYVPVLSVTTAEGKEQMGEEDASVGTDTVTCLVTPAQALLLNRYEYSGKMHMALVYRGDMGTVDDFIAKQDAVLAKGGTRSGQ